MPRALSQYIQQALFVITLDASNARCPNRASSKAWRSACTPPARIVTFIQGAASMQDNGEGMSLCYPHLKQRNVSHRTLGISPPDATTLQEQLSQSPGSSSGVGKQVASSRPNGHVLLSLLRKCASQTCKQRAAPKANALAAVSPASCATNCIAGRVRWAGLTPHRFQKVQLRALRNAG